MEQLIIDEAKNTPGIKLNSETGILEINGKSLPENAFEFYKPIFKWIEEYKEKPNTTTVLNIQLSYFNIDTALCLTDILKEFEAIHKNGKKIEINWIYNDEYMLESGQEYSSFINIPMHFVEKEPMKIEFPFSFN